MTTQTAPAPRSTRTTQLFVIGASGMLSGEFLRLAAGHPGLALAGAVSRTPGRDLGEVHGHLEGEATIDLAAATRGMCEVLADPEARAALVLGLPHGEAAAVWRGLREQLGDAAQRLYVVDLSADYRLSDGAKYKSWYGADHPDPQELASFTYGLPELQRAPLRGATRVAAPGCFATALQLASVPAARAGWLKPKAPWCYTAVTGSSGSGVQPKATTHHPFRHANLWAYGLEGHRHEAELLQSLGALGIEPELCFVPHSGPFARGIHLTAMLPLRAALDTAQAIETYRETFADEPFVRVVDRAPDLRSVVGSNTLALSACVRGETLIVLAALDNMIKGGAGQALQCLNLMLGHPEDQGLPHLGLGVV
jgi:N-acetyl-gamma-glutamyl-phosphate reductase